MRIPTRWGPSRTLADEFSPRANSIGFLRLVLATSVLVAHAGAARLRRANYGLRGHPRPARLRRLGVYGFFVLSGFLITASGMRFSLPRYAWHRFLRIFPGFWVCLVVTAFVIMPLVALYERDTLAGFWNHPNGPFDYIVTQRPTACSSTGSPGCGPRPRADDRRPVGVQRVPVDPDLRADLLRDRRRCSPGPACCAARPALVVRDRSALYAVVVADFVRQLPATNTVDVPARRDRSVAADRHVRHRHDAHGVHAVPGRRVHAPVPAPRSRCTRRSRPGPRWRSSGRPRSAGSW